MSTISLPRVMEIGAGSSGRLASLLGQFGFSNPLLVADPFLLATESFAVITEGLQRAGLPCRIFSGIVPDPTIAALQDGLRMLREQAHDCVVGIGGGSALDTAKALAVFSVHGGEPAHYKVPHVQDAPGLPIIAIPTTAGTGSEATRFTVITDERSNEKMLCVGLAYLPVAALVDYELTLTKPRRLTIDTAIDSLTHAIEAFVSRRANPFSDGMATLAMGHIGRNLRRVVQQPSDRDARAALMLGATQAGIAFSNSSVALVHGMSRPIGALFHVPHGLSNAMLLPIVTEFSSNHAAARYAACARAMGIAAATDADDAAVAALHTELRALNRELDVPSPRNYGIDENAWFAAIDQMAAQALASGSPANNPRVPAHHEIAELYRRVWAAN
jgi:alcohol dehydrogenase class IV